MATKKTTSRRTPPGRTFRRPRVLVAQSWWQDRLLEGVAQYAAQHNWVLDCDMRWTHRVPLLEEWRGDGVIAYVGVTRPLKSLIDFILAQRAPVVLTHPAGAELNFPSVIIPHEEIGRAAAEHLLSLGFQHFGFVDFGDNVMERERCAGFRHAVEKAGHAMELIHLRNLPNRLRHLPKPMGLLAINDQNALAVMRICLDGGFRIPEQFAIVGADNTEILCKFAPVPLTSVNCNFEKQGYEAAALLDRLMHGARWPDYPLIISPNGVIARRSTDTLAMPDADATRALRFLRDHYRKPIHLSQIGPELDQSFRRAQIQFRRFTGRTMFQELIRLRVEHAKQLLQNPKIKMAVVATDSGFGNRHHFIRAFRRTTGKTPRAFRAALKGHKAKLAAETLN
jgi:LacI family transcriptional regulator